MRYRVTAVLIVLLAGGLLWWVTTSHNLAPVVARSTDDNPSKPAATHDSAASAKAVSTEVTPEAAQGTDTSNPAVSTRPRPVVLAAAAEMPTGPETGPGLTPVTVLENMRVVFRQYSSRFGGNPVGNNPEITAALNGANPRQVVFLNPDDGMRVNERGELVDNWGTPYFFHQLSGTEMEIHSAGPDRKMWTHDDLVIK